MFQLSVFRNFVELTNGSGYIIVVVFLKVCQCSFFTELIESHVYFVVSFLVGFLDSLIQDCRERGFWIVESSDRHLIDFLSGLSVQVCTSAFFDQTFNSKVTDAHSHKVPGAFRRFLDCYTASLKKCIRNRCSVLVFFGSQDSDSCVYRSASVCKVLDDCSSHLIHCGSVLNVIS